MPYRECALYNKAIKSQIDRENKIFSKDFTIRKEKKKYSNLFQGMDNSNPLNFDLLKKQTFRDIFAVKNVNTISIKKPLNYTNYSRQEHDIISQEQLLPIFQEYKGQILDYEQVKPPPFDLQLNMKLAKKRQKATLDKQCRKYIIKNIKTCTEYAKTQREKIRKQHFKKNANGGFINNNSSFNQSQGAAMTLNIDDSYQSQSKNNHRSLYDDFLNQDEPFKAQTPGNLRQRRLQIMRRNQFNNTSVKNQFDRLISFSPSRVNNAEPMIATNVTSLERPATGIANHKKDSLLNSSSKNNNYNADYEQNKKLFFHRKTKSSVSQRRPLNVENLQEDVVNNRIARQQLQIINQTPLQINRNRDFSTIQNSFKSPPNRAATLQLERKNNNDSQTIQYNETLSQAEQIQKRSLSSYCRKKPTNLNISNAFQRNKVSRRNSIESSSQRSLQLSDKAQKAYNQVDKKAEKRLQNLERFAKQKKRKHYDDTYGYAMGFLDKLAQLNENQNDENNNNDKGVLLGDYQWNKNTDKNINLSKLQGNHNEQDITDFKYEIDPIIYDLKEEEQLINQVLFQRKNSKKEMLIQDEQQQQGENYNKNITIENQLIEERNKRIELESALKRLSGKIKKISKDQQLQQVLKM